MKKSWWKVPLYYVVTGLVCYVLEFQLLARFGLLTLYNGAVTPDDLSWLVITGLLLVLGASSSYLFLCHRMTRRELLCSAGITVLLNIVLGSLSLINWEVNSFGWKLFSFGWATVLTAWDDFIERILILIGLNPITIAVILWMLPLLFVLFGKKDQTTD